MERARRRQSDINVRAEVDDTAAKLRDIQAKVAPLSGNTSTKQTVAALRDVQGIIGSSEHPRETWLNHPDGTASIDMPIALSGETRITNNIDKTPFTNGTQKVKFTLKNVDDAGRKAFAAHVKSDVAFGADGDRHLDDSIQATDGAVIVLDQAVSKDAAYYLAWRGQTMTKEEFGRRYPNVVIVLEIVP